MKSKILFAVILAVVLSACTRTIYIPQESTHTEYRDRLIERVDSIFERDSIFIHSKGDTVFIKKYRDRYRDRIIRDTAFVERTDTIRIPYPVEKPLTKWQKIKQDMGGIAIGGLFALICFVVVWLVRRQRW